MSKHVLLIESATAERRVLLMELLERGIDISAVETTSQAMRDSSAGTLDAVIFRSTERRLALRALVKSLRDKQPSVALFVLGASLAEREDLASYLAAPISPLDGAAPQDLAESLSEALGLKQKPPAVRLEEVVWQSPRGTYASWRGSLDDGTRVIRSGTTVSWPSDWNRELEFMLGRLTKIAHPHWAPLCFALSNPSETCHMHAIGEGVSLAGRLGRSTLPAHEVARIGSHVAAAVQGAHEAPGGAILLGPLAPGQVWLAAGGPAQLINVGTSGLVYRFDRSVRAPHLPPLVAITSPEETRGDSVDLRTDVFFFGQLLYQLVTGREPFSRADVLKYRAAVRAGEYRDPAQYAPPLDPELGGLLARCLSPDPEQRPTPQALAEHLAQASEAVVAPEEPAPQSGENNKRWWRFW